MRLDGRRCSHCGECVEICPTEAIRKDRRTGKILIDQDLCVECGTCLRAGCCPEPGALIRPELGWPRILRRLFSDPETVHAGTGVPGRGTEEIKTNDVSGRLGPGRIGVSIDMGRPGLSTTFNDIQTVAMACAGAGARFEPRNPLTSLLADRNLGTVAPEVLGERVLSAIIEVEIEEPRLVGLLEALRKAEGRIATVFSVGLGFLAQRGRSSRILGKIRKATGQRPLPNGKINVGLGKPPFARPGGKRA